jgi:hypothetical protein
MAEERVFIGWDRGSDTKLEQSKYNAGVMGEINEGILVEVVVVLMIVEQQ